MRTRALRFRLPPLVPGPAAREPEGALRLAAREPEGALRLAAREPEGALRLAGPSQILARRSFLAVGLVLASSLLASCGATPTLPLPPPLASIGSPNLQGLVTVEGEAVEDAYVTVLNQDTEQGKITHAAQDGHFRVEIEASVGDKLVIWQESEGITGERTEQTVPEAQP